MPISQQGSTRALDHLLPLAERVSALTRVSGRAVLSGDAVLAREMLATDGECDRCDSAVRAAWSKLLGATGPRNGGQVSAVNLLVSLEQIADLAATICRQVVGLSAEPPMSQLPSIRRLAELVPEMLADALTAVRANDRPSAERVLDRSIAVDACFAQAHLDLLQAVRFGAAQLGAVQQLHAVGRALERISDAASEIAATVRRPVTALV